MTYLSIALFACGPGLDTSPPEEEPTDTDTGEPLNLRDTSYQWVDDTYAAILDDTAGGGDPFAGQDPDHVLHIEYSGFWDADDPGDPSSVVGELHVFEWLDDYDYDDPDIPYGCYWIYDFTGVRSGRDCPSCDYGIEFSFVLRPEEDLDLDPKDETIYETGIGDCQDPSPPPGEGEDPWVLGWSPSDETVYFDFHGSGIWVPWYTASGTGHDVEWLPQHNDYLFGIFVEEDTADTADL